MKTPAGPPSALGRLRYLRVLAHTAHIFNYNTKFLRIFVDYFAANYYSSVEFRNTGELNLKKV